MYSHACIYNDNIGTSLPVTVGIPFAGFDISTKLLLIYSWRNDYFWFLSICLPLPSKFGFYFFAKICTLEFFSRLIFVLIDLDIILDRVGFRL